MKYKTLTPDEAKAFTDKISGQEVGARLVFDSPLTLQVRGDGYRRFTLDGNLDVNWKFTCDLVKEGYAHIEVPEPEPADPFEIPCTPFKNVGGNLPTAVQWEYKGYSYTIHQHGSVIINGIDRGGFYRTIMSAHGNETLAANVYSIAKRIHDLAHRAHPFAVALDLEMFIESLTAEDDKSAIFVSADELLSDPSKEPNPFIKAMEAIQELKPADPFAHPAFEGWIVSLDRKNVNTSGMQKPYVWMLSNGEIGFNGNSRVGTYETILFSPANHVIVAHLGTIAGMLNSLLAADVSHTTIADTVKAFIESVTKESTSNP